MGSHIQPDVARLAVNVVSVQSADPGVIVSIGEVVNGQGDPRLLIHGIA